MRGFDASVFSALDVINLLVRGCVAASGGASGRVLRPKDNDWLVLYLKSIDLLALDRYDCSPVVALLEQLLHYAGFYGKFIYCKTQKSSACSQRRETRRL